MLNRRHWSGARSAALLLGAAVAFLVQLVAMTGLGEQWAGHFDVMQGDCGWDGTCSDAGVVDVTLYGLLALVTRHRR